ncbi:MAG: hypothetical protein EOP22_18275 [Hyphomicrobiales bacterium]|nr:MAG: hypothetical protein EOP22_18275 [Hyphomicrobiales bacterium]
MRITALAFGVLAGLVASLILALGGLDVSPAGTAGERQVQAIRFGLYVIGNLGFLGGAIALAVPLAGGALLVLAALAWTVAALLLHHTNELVLITPPVLLLLAAIPAFVAHFRPPRIPAPEPEIIAPLRRARPAQQEAYDDDDEPDVGMPNFGEPPPRYAEPPPRAASFSARDNERRRPADDDWNPGRRRTVPPRARPSFRPVDEDDEPSGFSRFALGASSLLSFGLYAVLAGAALLAFWTFRDQFTGGAPQTVATAEISSVEQPAPSSEPVLAPVLQEPAPAAAPPANRLPAIGGGAARSTPAPGTPAAAAAAVATPSSPSPEAVPQPEALPQPEDNFGDIVMSDDPMAPPRLVESAGQPFEEAAAPAATQPEPAPAEPLVASIPTVGSMMPRTPTGQMAAMRMAQGTGPTIVTTAPAARAPDAGL